MSTIPLPDGFDAPIATPEERRSELLWPGHWFDATGFAALYGATGTQCYHTGVDLNLNTPHWDADAHSAVYAAAHGLVVFAGTLPVWGDVVVIRHFLDHGSVWTRYAHVESLTVRVGDLVGRGSLIGSISNGYGRYPYHLHFDVAQIDLGVRPGDWPGLNLPIVLDYYLDPLQFILTHRPRII